MKILSCPFCGGKAEIGENDTDIYVECLECSARGEWFFWAEDDAQEKAIKAWNMRAVGWIKVEEDLPTLSTEKCLSSKPHQGYFVFSPTTNWAGILWYENEMWGRWEHGHFSLTKVYISHWMPLPQLPEGI